MTAKKTQCPFCESIFAVTPEQLLARGGHVRCGKCFQVFKADEHLVLPSPLGGSPLGSSPPPAQPVADIFDLLDQPNLHDDESDTLAGQPALPIVAAALASPVKASDLGKLEQKTELEPDFDALFSALAPQSIDPNESYAQNKHAEFEPDAMPSAAVPDTSNRQVDTPIPAHTVAATTAQSAAENFGFDLDLPALDRPQGTAPIQDTPLPGSVAAVILPALDPAQSANSAGNSVFNKKQQTSAKLKSLKLDDELSDLFLGDGAAPAKKDILQHRDNLGVDKLSSSADESWADALLQEEDAAKKAAAEQAADALLGTKKPPSVLKPSSAKLNTTTAKPTPDQSTHRSVALEEDDLLSYLSQVGAASEKTDDSTASASRSGKNSKIATNILPPPASHRIRVPERTRRSGGHHVAWAAMCGLLVLLLAVQWLYFNFSTLASNPQHNSRLTALCAIVGCQVPSMDLGQIATARLKVQRSPNNRQTTQVSLNLTNQANHSQLLPQLKFSQMEGDQVVAYRLVEPHEYLTGNDRQLKKMLPRQTLKVEFDLSEQRSAIKSYSVDPVYQ